MRQKVKILWSGITGRTGTCALESVKHCDYAQIVAGICRSDGNYYNYDELDNIKEDFDIIVDFSHKDSFDKVLNYAIEKKKPIIIGTANLSDEQEQKFIEASDIVPVFRGGNFRFYVKKFIDAVVEYAKTHDDLKIVETHYKNKKIPSETAKVVVKKVKEKTGKDMLIESRLLYEDRINDWRVDDIHCRVTGFEELADDILKIAYLMKDKKANGVYDLDRLLDESKTLIYKDDNDNYIIR